MHNLRTVVEHVEELKLDLDFEELVNHAIMNSESDSELDGEDGD